MVFGAKTITALVKDVTEDGSMDTFDATGNASVKMKSTEALQSLAEPLKKHKAIRKLILVDCDITDPGCEILADVLSENHVIEEVNLEKNKITSAGARALADGLAKNQGVRTLNLLQQATTSKAFGDDCLTHFIEMYNSNVTLTKITWRLDSRKSFMLAKLQTRNVEIRKRLDAGKDYVDLLPDHMRASPPDLTKPGAKPSQMLPKNGSHPASEAKPETSNGEAEVPAPTVDATEKAPEGTGGYVAEKPAEADATEKPAEADATEKPEEADATEKPAESDATEKPEEADATKVDE